MNRGKSRKDVGTTPEGETWSSSSQRFQSLPTDEDARSNPTPQPDQGQGHSPMSDTDTLRATDMNALAPYNYPTQFHQFTNFNNSNTNNPNTNVNGNNMSQQPNNAGTGPMSPRTTAAAASAFNLDPSILQTTIGSLLQSPAAAQLFLNSLNNSVQGQTLNTPNPVPTNQPSYPFPSQPTQPQPNQFQNTGQAMGPNMDDSLDPTLALFSPLPNQDGLMNHSDNLLKSYQGAAGMNQDVDKLQESIDSLVRSMGLEPNPPGQQPQQQQQQQQMGNGMVDGSGFEMGNDAFDSNFDVDQFLTELAKSEKQGQGQER
jgi:heat shock transcription factor